MIVLKIIFAIFLVLGVMAIGALIFSEKARRMAGPWLVRGMLFLRFKWQEYWKKRAARPKGDSHFHLGEVLIFLVLAIVAWGAFNFGGAKLSELHLPGWVWVVVLVVVLGAIGIFCLVMNGFAAKRRPAAASAPPKAAATASTAKAGSAATHVHATAAGGHGSGSGGGFLTFSLAILVLAVAWHFYRHAPVVVASAPALVTAAYSAPAPVPLAHDPPVKEVPLPGTQVVTVPPHSSTEFSDTVPIVNATACRPGPTARGYDLEYHDNDYDLSDNEEWKPYPEYGDPYANGERYRSTSEKSFRMKVCFVRPGDTCPPECPDPE